jgi:hypothetical protein
MSDTSYDQSPAMMAARGQTYGKRQEQMEAQRAVPMGRSPVEAPVARPRPAAPGSFVAPTQRPNEPITAGAPFGAGVGPAGAGIPMLPPSADNVVEELKAIYQRFPNGDLADLIDSTLREGY